MVHISLFTHYPIEVFILLIYLRDLSFTALYSVATTLKKASASLKSLLCPVQYFLVFFDSFLAAVTPDYGCKLSPFALRKTY